MTQALVPLKDLVRAKTRLAGLLSPSERRALAQAMVEDVLAVLAAHPGIERTTLVSDDPCAYLLAARYGAGHWLESELGCTGLNGVVSRAADRLLAEGAGSVLVLHADLPLLTAADISAVLSAARDGSKLVIGSDRHGVGTNLLCFGGATAPTFSFGENSCERHLAAARARGIPVTVLRSRGIGLDLDEPRDLRALLQNLDGLSRSQTAHFLEQAGLGSRISLALASLEPGESSLDTGEVR